jgi:hypothetical protein
MIRTNQAPQTLGRMKPVKIVFLMCTAVLFLGLGAANVTAQDKTFRPERTLSRVRKNNVGPGTLKIEAATTWCIDRGTCKYYLGSYHFESSMALRKPKINGQRIVRIYSPTTPEDPEAVSIMGPFHRFQKINPGLDFVVYEVDQPRAREGMEGVDFYPYQLEPGEKATLYGYVGIRGKLTRVSGEFTKEFANGLLEFHMHQPKGVNWPGVSGGLIVDEEDRAIGLVTEAEGDNVQAVPIWAIADFIWHEQRDLYQKLFPHPNEIYQPPWIPSFWATSIDEAEIQAGIGSQTSELRADDGSLGETAPRPFLPERYLRFHEPIPPVVFARHALGNRREESPDIRRAREQADSMFDRSRNLILGEDVWFGGDGGREVEARYEVRVVEGKQAIRLVQDGEHENLRVAYSPTITGVAPGDAWLAMPGLIATKIHDLPMLAVGDISVGGVKLKVFRFAAKEEDSACVFYSKAVFEHAVTLACEGEVWFTENFEMVRMEEQFTPPRGTGWEHWDVIVSYGQTPNPIISSAEGMLPATIFVEGKLLNGRKYHCFARITNVSGFGVSSRIVGQPSN